MNNQHIDKRLDEVYDLMDELMCAGKFEEVDKIIENLDLNSINDDIALGYLVTATWAKNKLKNRQRLYDHCLNFMSKEDLVGLE